MKYLAVFLLIFMFNLKVFAQHKFYVHVGTIAVYSTFSFGYESTSLIKLKKHQLSLNVGIGGWHSSLIENNFGTQSNIGIVYLYGLNKHKLEIAYSEMFHFDQSLKSKNVVFIGRLSRPYLGYRYDTIDSRIYFKVGIGWKELLQFGVGFNF